MTSLEPILKLVNIGKTYPAGLSRPRGASVPQTDLWALRNISVDVSPGEVLGVIGRNGAGKTTLLSIIAGTLSPTTGERYCRGKVLGLFQLGVGFKDELSGRENIFLNGSILGASRKDISEQIENIIEFSELEHFVDKPLGSYSQGMRLRLAFAVMVHMKFQVIVLDEVLAVGDIQFQSKCFERLLSLKEQGIPLVITTQGLDFIERLCTKVLVLEHGAPVFLGHPTEATNRYKALLSQDPFGMASSGQKTVLTSTKKWIDDPSLIGMSLGTKEVAFKKVRFLNRFGWPVKSIRSGDSLTIKVLYRTHARIANPHFGIAVFRKDGVYCHGPNTRFDGLMIAKLNKNQNGWFSLHYPSFDLADGDYLFSVAVWDEKEVLPYTHNMAYYPLRIGKESDGNNGLIKIPFQTNAAPSGDKLKWWVKKFPLEPKDPNPVSFIAETKIIRSAHFTDKIGNTKDTFHTNESATLNISLNIDSGLRKSHGFWAGIYRDDGIFCQSCFSPINGSKSLRISFPRLALLAGHYRIKLGLWNLSNLEFTEFYSALIDLYMVSVMQDHGTIYMPHKWSWKEF